MKPSNLRILVIAIVGAATSLVAVGHFVLTVLNNRLPFTNEAREFYLVVGRSYTEGFAIGFFFCFSLTVAATALSGLLQPRRTDATVESRPDPLAGNADLGEPA